MRIVYLHQYFNVPSGSSSTRSYELARRLANRGHDVHIVTTNRSAKATSAGWTSEQVAGFTVHRTHVPYSNSLSFRGRLRAFFRFARLASIKARQLRGDVIYATSTPLTIAIPAWFATAGRSAPMVFEVRDLWPEVPIAMGFIHGRLMRRAAYALQAFAYRHSAHIVALSPDMKLGIVDRGYPPENVTVIPNSADIDMFDPGDDAGQTFRAEHAWLGERPMALYCGTLGRVNDVRYIVRLAREALHAHPEYRFLIVGDGSERSAVEALASSEGVLGNNLFLFERRPKSELSAIYAASTVAISTVANNTALWANSANKVFDAFAAGRPVAINHLGWQADLLQSSGAGVVLDPEDLVLALSTLATLMSSPEQARRAGQAAQQLAHGAFSRDLHGKQLATILESTNRR